MGIAALTVDRIETFLLVFVRVGTMLTVLPVFGNSVVIRQLKVGLALILSAALFPLVEIPGPPQAFAWGLFVLTIVKEIAVGLIVGLVASTLFAAVQFAGRMIDMQMGFSFVELVDPTSNLPVTAVGQLLILVFTIMFLMFNGHYFLLLAIRKSFEVIPLGGLHYPGGKLAYRLTELTGGIFEAGLLLGAPVLVTQFITFVAMGIVARTVPQINIFFVGMPLQIMLGLGLLAVSLPIMADSFRKLVDGMVGAVWKVLYLLV